MDSIISIALSSQVTAWQVRDTVEQRAKRGASSDLGAILAAVPDVPPAPGDEKFSAETSSKAVSAAPSLPR